LPIELAAYKLPASQLQLQLRPKLYPKLCLKLRLQHDPRSSGKSRLFNYHDYPRDYPYQSPYY
jgi:hypothetical protein